MVLELDVPPPTKSLPLTPFDILQNISDADAREVAGQSYPQLLNDTFAKLSSALEANSPDFDELRAKYGQRLKNFWVLVLSSYAHATSPDNQSLRLDGETVAVGNEQISARLLGERGEDGDQVLQITRKTPTDQSEASIVVVRKPDDDKVSLHLQAVRSETLPSSNNTPSTRFEVSLNGTIGRISRNVIRTDSSPQHSTITDSRIIESSASN